MLMEYLTVWWRMLCRIYNWMGKKLFVSVHISHIAILETNIHQNPSLIELGVKANCSACILRNAAKYALRNLNVDRDNAGLKFYGHFSMSTNIRETLKILIHLQIQNYLKFFTMYRPGGCLCYHALRVYYTLEKLYN